MRVETMRVYVIVDSVGDYKVGVAKDVVARMRQLQTAHSDPLILIRLYRVDYAREREVQFHEAFRDYRKSGEWFSSQLQVEDIDGWFTQRGFAIELSEEVPVPLYYRK